MSGIQMRSQQFKSIVEPLLNTSFNGVYDMRKNEWKQIFASEDGIKRSYHEEVVLFGFGAAPKLPDGQPVTYDEGGQLYVKRYRYDVYGLAFAITKVLVEDGDHIRVGTTYAQHLAQSIDETLETLTANHLNRAFNGSYVGGDGVALVSNAHPVVSGTQSNLLSAAALSQTSLEQALIEVRKAEDARGKKIRVSPRQLIVAPANMMVAEVLLNSVLRTGTNNNDINPVKSTGMVSKAVTLSRLTSPTAWFMQTDARNGLKVLWRRKVQGGMEGDFETDSVRYKKTMRLGSGWTEWRCVWGNTGL